MQSNNSEKQRAAFVVELLTSLKEVCCKLKDTGLEIEKSSGKFYEEFFHENVSSINGDIDNYKSNIEKIARLKSELTEAINAWYSFTKDTNEIKKLAFPLKFLLRKKKLKFTIKRINDSISNITIENRFIKENLTVWEHKLELESIEKIKKGNGYSNFELLQKRKNELIEELKIILPTLPGICPVELDPDNLDNLIETLKKTDHAA